MNEWISVLDRLPKHKQHVLTYGIKNTIYTPDFTAYETAVYEGDSLIYNEEDFASGHFCEGSNVGNVTHWMPLPNPPEDK
jgi:hypothetical protein